MTERKFKYVGTHPIRHDGETPIVPPLATVADALRCATAVRFEVPPMSPPRVLEAIDQRNGNR